MPPVLKKLTLSMYRGVSCLDLEDLTPISLVVGANNSGKSSILEAASLLLRPPDPTQWVSAVRHRDIDMSLVDGLWSLFPHSEALHTEDGPQQSEVMVLEGSTTSGVRRVEAHCLVSESVGMTETTDLSARIEVNVDGNPALTLKFPAPAAVTHEVPMFRVFTVTPATHYSTKALVEHLSRVVDEGKKQLAIQLLQLFDPNVEDLDVVASQGREAVRVSHRGRGIVDLASFGDGMRRSTALALALTRASQGVLLIDEIETGIHHTVLRPVLSKLLEAAATSEVQIIATTHSLEALDAIIGSVEDRETPDALSAFWVKRQDTQHEVRRYDFEKLCVLREAGMDIR
jgi:energy-coupling factor transporter ATP-binding protein EcfA2